MIIVVKTITIIKRGVVSTTIITKIALTMIIITTLIIIIIINIIIFLLKKCRPTAYRNLSKTSKCILLLTFFNFKHPNKNLPSKK